MQFNEENIKALTHYLQQTINPDKNLRVQAETYLKQISSQPGFSVLLLRLLELNIPEHIKLSGAVFFKNLVKQNWINKESNFIPQTDREQIKAIIVNLMLSVPRKVQQQLSAALELISEHDFPNEWQNLLPELVSKFQTQDFNIINGVLRTAAAIFKRYRHMMKSQNVLLELKYVLDIFQAPLLQLFQATAAAIEQNKSNSDFVVHAFQSIKLMLKIFYSLNNIDLPEFFEDHMMEWMTLFRNLLVFESKDEGLVGDDDDDEPGLLHKVKSCVCENINLYAEKYEEEFNPYYETFLKDIWTMLMKLPTDAKYDSLVISGIRFLTILANGVYNSFYKAPELIKTVCEQIVIPSLKLRPIDLELFEDNPIEYIRRDIEGSDSDTRRRAATELVKGLRKHYEREVTQICSAYIGAMLQQYTSNPNQNWVAKDVAIYLVTALAIRGITQKEGTTNVNELVPVLEFFANQIIPELQTDVPAAQILKADALKFVTTFRQQLPKEAFVTVLPLIIKNLTSNNHVVKTYAANAVERLLIVKDRVGGTHVARVTRADLKPLLADLLSNLFKAVEESAQVKENDYVMKAIMRVIATAQEDILPYSAKCIQVLVTLLNRVYQNPTNPSFTHYLFESIATMVKSVAVGSPDALIAFEKLLFEPFGKILELDIQEFAPYVFQILSVFLEVRTTPGLSDLYLTILPPLLSPLLWERVSNIPALVRLVQAYLKRGGKQVIQAGQLEPILGVFKEKLVFSKTRDHEGFYLLESLVEYLAPEDFGKYMPTIFTLIFTRLSQNKTTKFVKSFLVWLSLFIGKHGAGLVVQMVDAVQPNLFVNILDSLWLPNIQKVNGPIERKMASLAMTKMLVEPKLMVEPYAGFWPKILSAAIALLELPEDDTAADEEVEIDEVPGYEVGGSGFSPLAHANKGNADPFPDMQPKPFLAMALYKLCREYPGRFPPVIQSAVHPEAQAHLMSYFKAVPTIAEPYLV